MRYLLDTNILLLYLREDKIISKIESDYKISNSDNLALISVVSKGELLALVLKNNWGEKRLQKLETFFEQFFTVDIAAEDIIER